MPQRGQWHAADAAAPTAVPRAPTRVTGVHPLAALQRQAGNRSVVQLLRGGALPGAPSVPVTVQRVLELHVDGATTNALEGLDAQQAFEKISEGMSARGDTHDPVRINWRNPRKRARILAVLDEWIRAPKQAKGDRRRENPSGVHALHRSYETYHDVARAVLDRVGAAVGVEIEERLARELIVSEALRERLVAYVVTVLQPKLGALRKEFPQTLALLDTLPGEMSAKQIERLYTPYLATAQQSIAQVLAAAPDATVAALISAIHDVSELLYKPAVEAEREAKRYAEVPEDKLVGKVLLDASLPADAPPGRLPDTPPTFETRPLGKYRGTAATPVQGNAQVATAGRLGYPVSMGPSRSVGKLMVLAQSLGASTEMKEGLAWAIFALWYTEYRRDLTDIHRYHFVMDMAANFGVPYDPVAAPRPPGVPDFGAIVKAAVQDAKVRASGTIKDALAQGPAQGGSGKDEDVGQVTRETDRAAAPEPAARPPEKFTSTQQALLRSYTRLVDQGATTLLIPLPTPYGDSHTREAFGMTKTELLGALQPLFKREHPLLTPTKEGLVLTDAGREALRGLT